MATLGNSKNGRKKTNRRENLNVSANSTPLKASDRNVTSNYMKNRINKDDRP